MLVMSKESEAVQSQILVFRNTPLSIKVFRDHQHFKLDFRDYTGFKVYVLSFREGEEEIRETNKQAVMYGCEKWTIKKAESQRIDASELWFGEDL